MFSKFVRKTKEIQSGRRKGIALVVVLIVVVVAGMSLSENLNVEATFRKKADEDHLVKTLKNLRQSFDFASRSPTVQNSLEFQNFITDTSNSENLRLYMIFLARNGLLMTNMASTTLGEEEMNALVPKDPTVSEGRWNYKATGSQSSNKFWKMRINLVENSSFETKQNANPTLIASWTYDSAVASPSANYPNELNVFEDDLPRVKDGFGYQNKFGQFMSPGRGQSIECTAP